LKSENVDLYRFTSHYLADVWMRGFFVGLFEQRGKSKSEARLLQDEEVRITQQYCLRHPDITIFDATMWRVRQIGLE